MIIQRLKVSLANLQGQVSFYKDMLNLPVKLTETGFEVLVGNSLLEFSNQHPHEHPYHIAFNIPFGHVESAIQHLSEKIPLLPFQGSPLIDFSSWNAKALYFEDADGNVMELIGRERIDVPENLTDHYSHRSILSISEIGFPTTVPEKIYEQALKLVNLKPFDFQPPNFYACGDDEGLFILVNSLEKNWFPTPKPAKEVWFELNFEVERKRYYLEAQYGTVQLFLPLPVEG